MIIPRHGVEEMRSSSLQSTTHCLFTVYSLSIHCLVTVYSRLSLSVPFLAENLVRFVEHELWVC
jgi:hypothetical protein